MLQGRCRASSPSRGPAATPAPARVVVPPRPPAAPSSVSDLAQFSPQGSSFVIEPGEWSLPRVPTNVYSTAAAHQVSGVLLGWPMEVRFTPVRFHWSFGDGARATHGQPGSSWGAEQFSQTPSSHVYAQPGTYQVSVVVDYDVAFRWQGQSGFTPVAGSISQPGGSRALEVLRVTPVLVDRGCAVSSLVNGRC